MQVPERVNKLSELLIQALDGRQSTIWTAMPGIVQSFDPVKMTCSVQVSIQLNRRMPNGEWQPITIPVIDDCPVLFPGGGGFTFTTPIATGDEALLIFASRCIDQWWQQGGVQAQWEYRLHDLSDGFVLVGPRSQPRVISGISTTSAQLRSDDGEMYIELAAGHVCNVVAPGGVTINGVTIDASGNVHSPAAITATGGIQAGTGGGDSVTVQGHTHGSPPGPPPNAGT